MIYNFVLNYCLNITNNNKKLSTKTGQLHTTTTPAERTSVKSSVKCR